MDISSLLDDETEARARRELGRRIVSKRTERGMAQVDLAKELGIDRSRLGKWERGLHTPLLTHLMALAKVLETSLDELLIGQSPAAEPAPKPIDRAALAGVVEMLNGLLQSKAQAGRTAKGGSR
jgi:transcriptional regulator with XRE-family HTH domain